MNISNSQVNRLRHFVRAGLRSLFRPEPQTAVEWADANYYLPKESAYQEGRWETLPFQRAIMNAMGSDYIREVNVVKSARVGYSKMLLGVYAYFIEHKQRNTLIWLPTDGDAENFMKTHVEPTIRDIPSLLALAPWYGKKHRDNTLTMKRFTNGRGFWCLGGKAAKNYREKSVDVAGYDELAAFDDDIEQEGSPTFLGDKRIEGSVWPKSIRGSTPKVRGTCQIERAASESPHFMRFHVACPHCGEEQYLKFGDKETPFGLKWTPDDPSSVFYLCEHNACVIRQQELDFTDARYICEKTGIWTRDGILWFSSSGEEIEPPDSVTFHIWTAYSPFTTWVQIVKDWMKTKGDTGKRKTFVNTTLGETWEAKIGERPDAYHLAGIEMPDFHREDDWWRHGQNLYLDNLEATGLYQVPLSSAQPGDVLLCCFGSSVPNHAAIYCGDGELLHHIPEQLSKRERYTDKWQRRTHSLWRHRAWRASAFTGICNDLAAASTFV